MESPKQQSGTCDLVTQQHLGMRRVYTSFTSTFTVQSYSKLVGNCHPLVLPSEVQTLGVDPGLVIRVCGLFLRHFLFGAYPQGMRRTSSMNSKSRWAVFGFSESWKGEGLEGSFGYFMQKRVGISRCIRLQWDQKQHTFIHKCFTYANIQLNIYGSNGSGSNIWLIVHRLT